MGEVSNMLMSEHQGLCKTHGSADRSGHFARQLILRVVYHHLSFRDWCLDLPHHNIAMHPHIGEIGRSKRFRTERHPGARLGAMMHHASAVQSKKGTNLSHSKSDGTAISSVIFKNRYIVPALTIVASCSSPRLELYVWYTNSLVIRFW